jgi:hypothetical protein
MSLTYPKYNLSKSEFETFWNNYDKEYISRP